MISSPSNNVISLLIWINPVYEIYPSLSFNTATPPSSGLCADLVFVLKNIFLNCANQVEYRILRITLSFFHSL